MPYAFKRLLIIQDDTTHCQTWTRQGIELAATLGADVTGLHVEPPLVRQTYVDGDVGQQLRAIQKELEQNRNRALHKSFDEAVKQQAISSNWVSVVGDPAVEARRLARYSDLTILGYPHPKSDDMSDLRRTVEHIAVGSGCPTLVIPADFGDSISLKKIAIFWDCSRESYRALRDAVPFLSSASEVTVFVADEEGKSGRKISIPDLEAFLHAHGIEATIDRFAPTSHAVGHDLLKKSNEAGSDMIVLGAYGHSRLRDLVLGGVTGYILNHARVPLLLSH